ncbi:HD domain-containing phosphohydrolase [Geobacter sp.]|uniref:HD-GYP domain-containing protein n=1 Tax=Geobacter sp. TaxID=46610 RepID=UPI0026219B4F|nr:HD domain-containing phosphohydrolase [Geobacter sp.]
MKAERYVNGRKTRIAVLIFTVVVVALFHFLIPTAPHTYHKIHIVLRKLYFLPPVMAGAWFGLRGAALTTAVISVVFVAHAIVDWPGNYMEQANQLGELAGFWVVGLVPGWLFDRRRALMESLARANEETLLALVSALDMRERNTRLHSQRVREYTLLLANRFGVAERERRAIGLGALLHDVGKIAVTDRVLLKPAGLTEDEWREMRRHPGEGYRLLRRIGFLREAAEIVYAHHEHYDGTGYPRGLKGEEIPLGARLFMVADVFDALTSERPYHEAMGYQQAARVIRENRGKHFDPAVVNVFEAIRPEEWEKVRKRFADANGDTSIR